MLRVGIAGIGSIARVYLGLFAAGKISGGRVTALSSRNRAHLTGARDAFCTPELTAGVLYCRRTGKADGKEITRKSAPGPCQNGRPGGALRFVQFCSSSTGSPASSRRFTPPQFSRNTWKPISAKG